MAEDEKIEPLPPEMLLHVMQSYLYLMAQLPGVHQVIIAIQMQGEQSGMLQQCFLCPDDAHFQRFMTQMEALPGIVRAAAAQAKSLEAAEGVGTTRRH